MTRDEARALWTARMTEIDPSEEWWGYSDLLTDGELAEDLAQRFCA